MIVAELIAWLEASTIATWVRESTYGFVIMVAVHILGLTFSVGILVWFDLRLLGVVMRTCPVSRLYRALLPWLAGGFAMVFASGAVLFCAFAAAAIGNLAFQLKMTALLVAAVNALVFHFGCERGIAGWDSAAMPPAAARIAGAVSIAVWAAVIVAGRVMSYTMF